MKVFLPLSSHCSPGFLWVIGMPMGQSVTISYLGNLASLRPMLLHRGFSTMSESFLTCTVPMSSVRPNHSWSWTVLSTCNFFFLRGGDSNNFAVLCCNFSNEKLHQLQINHQRHLYFNPEVNFQWKCLINFNTSLRQKVLKTKNRKIPACNLLNSKKYWMKQ